MNVMARLRAEHASIVEHLHLLNELLRDEADLDAHVYAFPLLTEEDIGEWPDSIELSSFKGTEAVEKALTHLSFMQQLDGQPGLFSRRLAGHLHVACADAVAMEIRERVNCINQLKENFQHLVLSLSHSLDERFALVKEALPGLCKIAAYRQLLLPDQGLQALRFSWVHRRVGRTYSKAELIKQIETAQKRLRQKVDAVHLLQDLDIETQNLNRYPDSARFVQKRSTRVTAIAKLTYQPSHIPRWTTMHTHSPIIIINDKPKIGELADYQKRETDVPAVELEMVSARREIFVVKRYD